MIRLHIVVLLLFLGFSLFAQRSVVDRNQIAGWAKEMFRTDASAGLIPEFEDAYGVVFRDLNGDRLPDLYVVRFRNLNRLFLNNGVGKPFTDATIRTGLGGNLMSRGKHNLELGASAADYDNNGLPDILIVGWDLTTRLFRQLPKFRFMDVTRSVGIPELLDGNAGVWADVNLDGNLDLFITDEHRRNRLLLSRGNGKFTDVTVEFGIQDSTTSQGAAFGDVDNDGYPDLYVANWFAPDRFYRNVNGIRFEAVSLPLPHLQKSLNSNGVTFADLDNDGDLDLIVTDRDGRTSVYRNQLEKGNSRWDFYDVTEASGVRNPFPAYGSVVADFNNDGWQDIYFTNIGPNQLFVNRGGFQFELTYQEPYAFLSYKDHYSTGAAVADVDRDGDLDLFVANKDTISLIFVNPINNRRFIQVDLEGIRSNRDAIGGRVWLYGKDSLQNSNPRLLGFREISGGGSYLSFSDPLIHFGVASDEKGPFELQIEFPGGKQLVVEDVLPGHVFRVSEYQGVERFFLLAWQKTMRVVRTKVFWVNLGLFLAIVVLILGYAYLGLKRYRWGAGTITVFLGSVLILFYLIFILFPNLMATSRLLIHIAFLILVLGVTTGFMEKIRQMEKQRFGYRRVLQNFSQQIVLIHDNQQLYEQLVQMIRNNLPVRFCVLFEPQNGSWKYRTAAGEMDADLPEKLIQTIGVEFTDAFFESDRRWQFLQKKDCVYLPVAREQKFFAVLVLGLAASGKLPPEDIAILEVVTNQAALAIENNRYIQETKELIQKATEAEIQKRYIRELEEKNRTLQQLYQELKETQTQLIQSEKMASLGQLVAGIAHELNNPISYVYANMKALQEYIRVVEDLLTLINDVTRKELDETDIRQRLNALQQAHDLNFIRGDIHQIINESLRGSERVREIIRNLRNFSRLDEAEVKEVDLHEGLDSTLMLLNNEIKNRITVHKEYGDIPGVICHPGHINQVFMNLLLNAIQAIEGKGNIWIRTRSLGDQVEIEIQDDGKGIPPDVVSKIFDPFFTTKPVGTGTGLGLSITYNIIKTHGGTITVESEVSRGTVFRIHLPVKGKRD